MELPAQHAWRGCWAGACGVALTDVEVKYDLRLLHGLGRLGDIT